MQFSFARLRIYRIPHPRAPVKSFLPRRLKFFLTSPPPPCYSVGMSTTRPRIFPLNLSCRWHSAHGGGWELLTETSGTLLAEVEYDAGRFFLYIPGAGELSESFPTAKAAKEAALSRI